MEAAPAARRQLSAGRLTRLLSISALVRRNPRLKMADVLRRLGISRSQFYRDREELLRLGFQFGRVGRAEGFSLNDDPVLPAVDMTLSELLSLSAATTALARAGEAEVAYLALRSLLGVLSRLPEGLRTTLEPYVEEAVAGEGFGCPLAVLGVLMEAISEGRRIVVRRAAVRPPSPEPLLIEPAALEELTIQPMTLDPHRVALAGGRLSLEAFWVEGGREVRVPLAGIATAGFTPFLTPDAPESAP